MNRISYKMRIYWLVTFVLMVSSVLADAQEQTKSNVSSLIPLPIVQGWVDNEHFLLQRKTEGSLPSEVVLVEANTGKETLAPSMSSEKQKSNENLIAFTRGNDLYLSHPVRKKETRVTVDGTDEILNGSVSWVYMEEIFRPRAYWWSPDNKQLAFFRFDDSKVPVFMITDASGKSETIVKQHYPKAGDVNPSVKIGVVNTQGAPIVWADFDEHSDQYFGKPVWRPDGSSLLVERLNRGQDSLSIYEIDIENGRKRLIFQESQRTWIDLGKLNRIRFLKNKGRFIIQSDKTGWNHLYLFESGGKLIKQVTQGDYAVKDIVFIDEKKEIIFFTCRKDNVTNVDLYQIGFDGRNQKRISFGNYSFDVTSVSPSGKYFILQYSNIFSPARMVLVNNQGRIIKELGDAKGADFNLASFRKEEIVWVKSEDNNFDLPMRIIWPQSMQLNRKYRVSISIYGGPGSHLVNNNWNPFSYNLIDSVIYVNMDHRGSGLFGKKGMDYLHRRLGYWEMKDYIQCVKWLIANAQADPTQIEIQGSSYGGYLTCLALTYGADFFTAGSAWAPVTDWHFYDTHYTERYMDTPKENPEGYKNSSVLTYANKLKGRLQIAHGMIDDNVHLQNSIHLIDTLQKLGKKFEMMFYPYRKHR
jgi:dipeptidyl-peptidase-4